MPKYARTSRSLNPKFIPYKRGFNPPSDNQKFKALGWKATTSPPPEYCRDDELFPAIPKCISTDDWLAQVNEKGQTYEDFMKFCPWFPGGRNKSTVSNILQHHSEKSVYIVPVGDFSAECSPDFDALVEYAEIFLGVPVQKMNSIKVEVVNKQVYWVDNACDKKSRKRIKCRYDSQTCRYQLCIESALRHLKLIRPESSFCLIALTLCDLYEAQSDLFVAGMASGRDYVAIFSLFRYDPHKFFSTEFWYEVSERKKYSAKKRKQLILQRSCRLLVHEVAHLLGIDHCIFYACCMNGSGHLEEDFSQPMFLCPVDLRKLQALVGFNVLQRYRQLCSFFEKHQLLEEAEWTKRRIESISSAVDI